MCTQILNRLKSSPSNHLLRDITHFMYKFKSYITNFFLKGKLDCDGLIINHTITVKHYMEDHRKYV